MRGASNPGGVGHRWVKARFIDEDTRGEAVYVPAQLKDNPALEQESYLDSLSYLDPITRKQYEEGDWTVFDTDLYVFPQFNRKVHVGVAPEFTRENYRVVVAGADPGTRDPYAVGIWGMTWDGAWWMLDEFYKTGGTTQTWLPEFKMLNEKWKPKKWFVDKRKPSDIIDLRKGGIDAQANLDIHGERGRGTIVPMLAVLQNLLVNGKLHLTARCPNMAKEMENYLYRDLEDRNSGDVPVDASNHGPDQGRYAICSVVEGAVPGMPKQWAKGSKPREEKKPGTPVKIPSMADFLRHQDDKQGRMPGR
jgi:hypothetical protein